MLLENCKFGLFGLASRKLGIAREDNYVAAVLVGSEGCCWSECDVGPGDKIAVLICHGAHMLGKCGFGVEYKGVPRVGLGEHRALNYLIGVVGHHSI